MNKAGISDKSRALRDLGRLNIVRYAQLWEDAEVLLDALRGAPGRSFLSVCSAGDNALALLLLEPSRVVACDLSEAQLHCLRLRICAMQNLEYWQFFELMASFQSDYRRGLMKGLLPKLPADTRAFWRRRLNDVESHGLGGVGKFERYFSIFRRRVLPLIHDEDTVEGVFVSRNREDRLRFFDQQWDTWRWRLATNLFFSRFVMGRLGRDPAFFAHAKGSLSEHVRAKVRHAAVEMEPIANPYMQRILLGRHAYALPVAWRQENYETIRSRLDLIEIRQGPVDSEELGKFDGFNLSDIFEYMNDIEFEGAYGRLLSMSNPKARLVYWNMMAPRRVPSPYAGLVMRRKELEDELKKRDKAFFYSDFVIEELA